MHQNRWLDQDNAENARDDKYFQGIVQLQELPARIGFPKENEKQEERGETHIKINIHVADVVNIGQHIDRKNGQQAQSRNHAFGNRFAVNDRNRLVIIGQIAFDVLKILDNFADQKQQIQERRMRENNSGFDFIRIVQFLFVEINQDAEERENGEETGRQISDNRVFLEFVRIEPDQENIHRKEQQHAPRNEKCNERDKKVEREIHIQFGALAHQAVEHGFARPVDQILFGIVKIIDNVARSNRQARCEHKNKYIGVEQDFHRAGAFGRQDKNRRQILRNDNDGNVVAAHDREQAGDFS